MTSPEVLKGATIERKRSMRVALTIAGSDSCGGAGIQADIKTFTAVGVYGMSVVTALTAQNTGGVLGVHEVPAPFISRQLEAVLGDIPPHAAKTGMLFSGPAIEAVARALRENPPPHLVVDPVMAAGSGDPLLKPDARSILAKELFPITTLLTPNLEEAALFSGIRVASLKDMHRAARRLLSMGPKAVLIKGGHLKGPAIDLLFDGERFREFSSERLPLPRIHGAGCTISAAITAWLARGEELEEAVLRAKAYVAGAIREAFSPSGESVLLNHMFSLRRNKRRRAP